MAKLLKLPILIELLKFAVLIGTVFFIVGSCTPGERMAKLIDKHPELVKSDSTDKADSTDKITKTITNTGRTLTMVSDSALNKSSASAPIVHDSNGIKTSVYHYHNTTYINSQCPPDTVIREVKEVHHYHTEEKYYPLPLEHDHWSTRLLWGALGALALLLLLRLLKL